jgi:beta-phosphoglucomutase-like phosphatase (HAD superfamily)
MTQAVLFDVDGTLIDSVDLHAKAWQEAFAKFGVRVSFDEVRSQIGKGGDQLIPCSSRKIARRGSARSSRSIAASCSSASI